MLGKIFFSETQEKFPQLPLSFSLVDEKDLHVFNKYDDVETWDYYSHHVGRYPQDLRVHAQRIFLGLDADMSEYLSGALQDMYIALGSHGRRLRERMLALVRPKLSEEEQLFFDQWLRVGFEEGLNNIWRQGSVLVNGTGGKLNKLVKVETSQEEKKQQGQYAGILEEVQSCLEYGQVDTAQKLLEDELLQGNENEKIEQELINIYQYTRDREKLENMNQHLVEKGRLLSPAWRQLQQESENW